MDISIVIVNYNMKSLVTECIASLERLQAEVDFEVFLIDNASSDGSADSLRKRFPWISVMENHENAGFARACNQGVRLAQGDYVLFLNPDTEMLPGTLDSVVDFFVKNPDAGIVGCKTVNSDGSLEPSVYRFPTLFRTLIDTLYLGKFIGGYEVDPAVLRGDRRVEVVCGACFFARRSLLDSMGAFDEEFWMYGEDVELCMRALKAGFRSYYLDSCSIIHKRGRRHLGEDSFHDMARISYNHYKWIFCFYRKHRSGTAYFLLRAIMAAQVYPKLWSRRRKFKRGDKSKNNMERLEGLSRVMNEFVLGREK